MTQRRWISGSEEESRKIGAELSSQWAGDLVVLLYGEMGSGKTVFTQGIAAGLGVDPREVQSPTFNIVREHTGSATRLLHLDLYRLETADLDALAIDEILLGPGIKVVEWADRLASPLLTGLGYRLAALADGRHEIEQVDVRSGRPSVRRPVL